MDRRRFLQSSAAIAALNAFPHSLYDGNTRKNAFDRIKLGPKGVELSRLAMGTGANGTGGSSNQTRKLGVSGVADLFRSGYDHGLNFWDTADQYGAHPHAREALKSIPREKVTLLSKTRASTAKEMRADLDRFRRELNSDYIDILLLHCMIDGNRNTKKRGAMDVITEARERHRPHERRKLPYAGCPKDRSRGALGGSRPGSHQSGWGGNGCRSRNCNRRIATDESRR